MDQGDATPPEALGVTEATGAVLALLDESYSPFVAAAATVIEETDADRLNAAISRVHDDVQGRFYLDGLESFLEFRERGFHATSDPFEVRIEFIAFLARALEFKSLIVYSDKTLRKDLSEKQLLMVATHRLARDIIRAYRGRPRITFLFESAHAMDPYTERVVVQAAKSLKGPTPAIDVKFGVKRQPDLLALPDYVLHVFNQWLATKSGGIGAVDPADNKSRSFKAILGSVSSARNLDNSRVIRRTTLR